MKQQFKKIGIVGGMGPLATLNLYEQIVQLTPASKDQDHLPVVINITPQIPDRSDYILGRGENPKEALIISATELKKAGAQILAIPCNTAHFFITDIKQSLPSCEIVDMIFETKEYLEKKLSLKNKKPLIGLLATEGTIKSKLYQKYFKGYKFVFLNKGDQAKLVNTAIYGKKGIKNGYTKNNRKLLRNACKLLQRQGAELIILGCTEISMVMSKEKNNGVRYLNPIKILAISLINKSLNYS